MARREEFLLPQLSPGRRTGLGHSVFDDIAASPERQRQRTSPNAREYAFALDLESPPVWGRKGTLLSPRASPERRRKVVSTPRRDDSVSPERRGARSSSRASPHASPRTERRRGSPASSLTRGAAVRGHVSPRKEPSMQRSQLGRQVDSGKTTAPSFKFGSDSRFDATEDNPGGVRYLGSDFQHVNYGQLSPGPVAAHSSSMGQQARSERRSANAFSFGTVPRFDSERREIAYKAQHPAPGDYKSEGSSGPQLLSTKCSGMQVGFSNVERTIEVGSSPDRDLLQAEEDSSLDVSLPGALGTQVCSARHTSAAANFGTDRRSFDKRTNGVPGPDVYSLGGSCGHQANSLRTTFPLFKFGTSDRDRVASIRAHEGQAAGLMGREGPGPGSTTLPDMNLCRRSLPSWGFSKAQRFRMDKSTHLVTPGAGSYRV